MYAELDRLMAESHRLYRELPAWEECPCCKRSGPPKDNDAYRAWSESQHAIAVECIRLGAREGMPPEEIAVRSNRPFSSVALAIKHERERIERENRSHQPLDR